MGHWYVGTEHLLLGLVAERGPAGRAFAELGVTLERRAGAGRVRGAAQQQRAARRDPAEPAGARHARGRAAPGDGPQGRRRRHRAPAARAADRARLAHRQRADAARLPARPPAHDGARAARSAQGGDAADPGLAPALADARPRGRRGARREAARRRRSDARAGRPLGDADARADRARRSPRRRSATRSSEPAAGNPADARRYLPDAAPPSSRAALARARGAPSWWARARSGRRSRCCSPAAASAPRCRRARPSSAGALEADRENKVYLPGVELPRELRVEPADNGLGRVDYCFLGVPSVALAGVISSLSERGLDRRTPVISLAKGLVPPHGIAPTVLLSASLGGSRVACMGGPAHAHEMVTEGAGLVAASTDARLAADDRGRLHARGRGLRAVERPDRRRARRAPPRTPPRWPRARRRLAGPQRRRRRGRPHLPRGLALRRAAGRAAGVDDRARRHRRPRRHRARAPEPQPPGRRAARPGRPGGGDPRPHRPGGRGARPRAAAGQRARPRAASRRRSPTRSTA